MLSVDRVNKLRKHRRDEAKRVDAKIKLQRMFRKKYSSNSLVLVETVLPPPHSELEAGDKEAHDNEGSPHKQES